MYRITICDDEPGELDKAEDLLRRYQKRHEEYRFVIDRFTDAEELVKRMKKEDYVTDLIFMDIYMPGRLGIDIVREMRDMGNVCRIIFLTTSKDFALDAFQVDADQYLVKPVQEKDFFLILDKLLSNLEREQKKYVCLRIDNKIHRIEVHDIVFCEGQKKRQCIWMADGSQYLIRMTMAKIYEKLSDFPEFVRVGVSYAVNLEHVESLNARELNMDNGKRIYLPRGSYASLRESYFGFYCEEGEDV